MTPPLRDPPITACLTQSWFTVRVILPFESLALDDGEAYVFLTPEEAAALAARLNYLVATAYQKGSPDARHVPDPQGPGQPPADRVSEEPDPLGPDLGGSD